VKYLPLAVALLTTASAFQPAYAGSPGGHDFHNKWRSIKWLRGVFGRQTLNVATEKVTCTGPNGTTLSYSTTTKAGRSLIGAVTVRIAGKTTLVPELLLTNFLNEDDQIVMKGYGLASGKPEFSLRMELIATEVPKTNEVATYAGMVSVGSNESAVTCSATRAGAGMLKPQIGIANGLGPLDIMCVLEGQAPAPGVAPLLNFQVSRTASTRLISDVIEVRSPTDSEALPSFLVAEFEYEKPRIVLAVDDGGPNGNLVARLKVRGVRVPTNQPAADPAIYGVWTGTYQRFDAGRELKAHVDCYAF